MASEVDFPRSSASKKDDQRRDKVLAEVPQRKPRKRRRDEESMEKPKIKKIKMEGSVDRSVTSSLIESLKPKNLSVGLLTLGCVREVKDFQVVVSLPGSLSGIIPITHIHDAYTQQLQQLAESQETEAQVEEEVASLRELFKPGALVACCVTEITKTKKGNKSVKLSVRPGDLNGSLSRTSLRTGILLYAAVSSCEDHGYVVDLGVKGTSAFLSHEKATHFVEAHNGGFPLKVGQGFWCCVNLGEQRVEVIDGLNRAIPISLDPGQISKAKLVAEKKVAFHAILPGNRVEATVEKVTSEGLMLRFLKYTGHVHKSQLSGKLDKYQPHQQVKATVLYVHPVTKVVDLTLRQGLSVDNGCPLGPLLSAFPLGEVLEAPALSSTSRGVLFKLSPQFKGFATMNNLSDSKVTTIGKEFKPGTVHRCRVLDFDPMEEVILVTLRKSILDEPVLNIRDVQIGQEVEAVVTDVSKQSIHVKIGRHVKGYIPAIHAADVLLSQLDKKFKEGDKLKCRVWRVEPQKSLLILTSKKSMVSPRHPIISSFEQLTPGLVFDGVIAQVNQKGALVVTFNNVKGWVPVTELAWERVEYPERLFRVGQVVACRVHSVKTEEQRALFSLRLDAKPSSLEESSPKKVKTKALPPEDFAPGKIVECKISHKNADGLEVKLLESGKVALLPKNQLSDWSDLCEPLYNLYQKGQNLKVMYYNVSHATIVTRKQVFFQAASEGNLITKFEDLEPGQVLPAMVKSHKDYGMFVEMPGGLFGLAPNQFALDRKGTPLSEVFEVSQSVYAKVVEVKQDKERFLVSTKLSDTFQGGEEDAARLLHQFLDELQLLQQLASEGPQASLASISPGSLTQATVSAVTEHGILCQLPGGVKALAVQEHMEGCDLKEGDEVMAVVLLVDWASEFVQVLLTKRLVKAVAHLKENKFTKVKAGQLVKAEVVLVKDNYVLAFLKGHAAGRLVFLPRQMHLNDVLSRSKATFGQVVQVEIDRVHHGLVTAHLRLERPDVSLKAHSASSLQQTSVVPGAKVEARILRIYPQQMNIDMDGVHGRVHITEIVDNIEEGQNPLSKFKKNQKIQVRVLGYRELKTHKFLPITHRNATKAIPECTLRPSKLSSKIAESEETLNMHSFKPGGKVTGFVQKCSNCDIMLHLSPTQRGRLDLLSLTHRFKILEKPDKHYRSGTAMHVTVDRVTDTGLLEVSKDGSATQLAVGLKVPAVVVAPTPMGFRLRLPGHQEGLLSETGTRRLKTGQLVPCFVVEVGPDTQHCLVSLSKPRSPGEEEKPKALKTEERREPVTTQDSESVMEESQKESLPVSKKRKRNKSEQKKDAAQDHEEVKMEQRPCLSVGGDFWQQEFSIPGQESSSEEEEEDQGQTKRAKKRLKRDTLAEEKRIQQLEASGGHHDLSSAEDFERLVLQSPDSSVAWIAFMSYFLDMAEVDKARAVVDRGLQTINFREEQEKKNLWAAYLSLEATYGTPASLKNVLDRAVQAAEPADLFLHLASLHIQAERFEEAEQVFTRAVRKCKTNRDVWMQFCSFCFEHGRRKLGEEMLSAACNHLRPDDYLELMGGMAESHYKHGDPELGRTTFLKLLGAYPAKVKLWLGFLRAEEAAGNKDQIKSLIQKLQSSDISKRKKDYIAGKYQTAEEEGDD